MVLHQLSPGYTQIIKIVAGQLSTVDPLPVDLGAIPSVSMTMALAATNTFLGEANQAFRISRDGRYVSTKLISLTTWNRQSIFALSKRNEHTTMTISKLKDVSHVPQH